MHKMDQFQDDLNDSYNSNISHEEEAVSVVIGMTEEDRDEQEQKKQNEELLHIVRTENQAVFCLRRTLLVCLLVSAIACALLVFLYSSNEEQEAYNEQFDSDAQKLFDSIGTNFDLTMGTADAFMFQIISQAKSTNTVWPYVTIPDLPQKSAKLISQTDSIYMAFYPLITGEKRQAWENFTRDNDGWVQDSLRVQARNPNFHGPVLENYNYTVSHVIWKNDGPESYENEGPFLPSWMGSPVIPSIYYPYNWNSLAYEAFSKGLVTGMETLSVVVTAVANHADPNDPVAVAQAATSSDWAIPYLDSNEDTNEPFADMYYPVIDSIDDVQIKTTDQTEALGSVGFTFYWRHVLKGSLPHKSQGVIIVFHNDCGDQVFTYQIDGKEPTFLGFEDLHDPQYDNKAMTRNLNQLINVNGIYSGLPMNDEFCPYTLTIYPSSTMKDMFVTKDPVIYAIAVTVIFLFTTLTFISYDWFVNRRQNLIKKRALASGEIVASLFPEQVRNQLYQDKAGKDGRNSRNPFGESRSLLATSNLGKNSSNRGGNGSPNAHLYKDTSIFFADLVGFTSWSSTRKPEEVFELLETLYGEFDKIARRRNVFKVETIGDCYVAATGIPDPQPQHAVIMAKFAQECLEKIHVVTQELAGKLGEDTMDLAMRVGVNSGSTTAGVLRGEKGRFQLFGDTVNTAARMESNGVKNRIQVSQATADELIKAGKGGWLIPRKESVVAKGKGEMKTYFVTVKRSNNTASVVSDPIGDSSSAMGRLRNRSNLDDIPSLLPIEHTIEVVPLHGFRCF
ncbi:Receptor-type guanylate cyclase gcy [Seminavis robusta]|uniref:Receptor-type guanylate cyclase gcy n=1 Tax=Seminavis robusta TaxID=568900 RepID=A0A9N8DUP2_9STRA|nr:Receptor-type guanylate cyclase gcy [Seminavis robusta]|eukprot:Sro304_g112610.1 Receptor-type guanylate cyclase gcy (789) ;mRNA; f:47018-50117